jgi:UDP-N-acetylglucosamine--N-acetylmuramyl-(pentapeptide) pyrophosphoryl-undecaprenol N-acetylglucosamine transferase
LPAIVIPYPFAYKHQLANAEVLAGIGSAILIKDDSLSGESLSGILEDLSKNPDRLKKMRSSYDKLSLSRKASDLLVDTVFSLSVSREAN